MKRLFSYLALSVACLFAASPFAVAQDRAGNKARPSPNASVSQAIGTAVVSVTYGRPGLKGRSLESLAPAGKVWRTGANESTAITFSTDVMLGGQAVSAGTYSLYTIPNASEWTIVINSKLSWGTQYDESKDVVRVKAGAAAGPNAEWFTISFDGLSNDKADLVLHWGATVATVPIAVKG